MFSTSKKFEMNSDEIFQTDSHTLLLKLYTQHVTRDLRLRYNDNTIFRVNILLNNKTQQLRFLVQKLQVFNGK